MKAPLRVAFFPDAFHEIDGVAMVGRRMQAYAAQHDLPLMLVHSGPREQIVREASVTRVELQRSSIKFPLDQAHEFDLLFLRHYRKMAALLKEFRPNLIQITGPSDVGILGAMLAHKLQVPLAAFWQTNLHQYAGLRAAKALSFLPAKWNRAIATAVQRWSFLATTSFYRIPKLVFAPNPELVRALANATGRPCFPMPHAVDTAVFSPEFRDRETDLFTIGYVGRLSAEKNVRSLARVEHGLREKGGRDFRIVVVGQGAEQDWLRENLRHGKIRGVVTGTDLSREYANMDVLLFPSETDTFGLAVLEALASGVPAIVTASGGPKYTVQHGKTGYVTENIEECVAAISLLMERSDLLASMGQAARGYAMCHSWENVFGEIYQVYAGWLQTLGSVGSGASEAVTV